MRVNNPLLLSTEKNYLKRYKRLTSYSTNKAVLTYPHKSAIADIIIYSDSYTNLSNHDFVRDSNPGYYTCV